MVRQLNWMRAILKDSGWKVSHSHARFLVKNVWASDFVKYFAVFKEDEIIIAENSSSEYADWDGIVKIYKVKKSKEELEQFMAQIKRKMLLEKL